MTESGREGGELLGKRQRSMLVLPSVAKQARQVSGGAGDTGAVGIPGLIPAAFLAACGLCGKGLGPGKDTYVYRGEVAFCSQECREWHIQQEEHSAHPPGSGARKTN